MLPLTRQPAISSPSECVPLAGVSQLSLRMTLCPHKEAGMVNKTRQRTEHKLLMRITGMIAHRRANDPREGSACQAKSIFQTGHRHVVCSISATKGYEGDM